ncbi:MAG: helix-turn-helix domain-containing protein [Anaerolineales bacterium]|nr:helix-turn-helix domain-containing protein [Anaerolineales bacterium]
MSETVGQLLRAAREAKGQTLEDVESVTRIRARHLAALEADDFAALPSLAQARGFVKNYAEYLDLDIQEVLGRYEAADKKRPARPANRAPVAPPPSVRPSRPPAQPSAAPDGGQPLTASARARASSQPGRPRAAGGRRKGAPAVDARGMPQVRRRRWITTDLLVAAVITLLLGALLAWGAWQLAPTFAATPTLPAAGALAGTNAALPSATATHAPAATATAALATPAAAYTGVNVEVRVELRSWVGVKVDGREVFAGLMPPGEAREFIGAGMVEVITGNGLGTRVVWNGVDQGVLGDLGEVVVRLWTLEGMITPTPTPTLAVTPTPGN